MTTFSPYHLLLLGPPSSGKGTLTRLLPPTFHSIATGTLLRSRNLQAKQHGQLVSDAIVNRIVYEEMQKAVTKRKNVIWDGFPRTMQQAITLKETWK